MTTTLEAAERLADMCEHLMRDAAELRAIADTLKADDSADAPAPRCVCIRCHDELLLG